MKIFIFFILFCCSLTSCIEILDDVTYNPDGSGEFKYTINLSSSKLKINSILALDSLDGKKVPSKLELQEKVSDIIGVLNCQEGIQGVSLEENYDNFIFKVSLHFDNVKSLLNAFSKTREALGNPSDSNENACRISSFFDVQGSGSLKIFGCIKQTSSSNLTLPSA